MSQPLVAVVDDLLFRVRIEDAARRHGRPLHVATTLDAALEAAAGAALVVIDLNIRTLDPLALIAALAAQGTPQLAYVSHVQVDLRRAAEAAGCPRVLARSTFSDRLLDLLAPAA